MLAALIPTQSAGSRAFTAENPEKWAQSQATRLYRRAREPQHVARRRSISAIARLTIQQAIFIGEPSQSAWLGPAIRLLQPAGVSV